MRLDDWFLAASERGNPATEIDRRHGDGTAWTEGNDGAVLSTAPSTSPGCTRCCATRAPGDWVYFTDWQGDPDEGSPDPAPRSASVIAELARSGRERARPALAFAPGGR